MPTVASTALLKGLALPAKKIAGMNYFDARTGIEVAWGDVLLALTVPAGTRPLNRAFGSPLHRYIFEPNDAQLRTMLQYIITQTVQTYVPYVRVLDVQSTSQGQMVKLNVSMKLVSDSVEVTKSVTLDKSAAIAALRGR